MTRCILSRVRNLALVVLAGILCFTCVIFADAIKPPDIMPVVILSGSDYEMGYQFGQQVAQYVELEKNDMWVSALGWAGSYDTVVHQLKAVQYYIKKYAPEAIEGMKGIADGATDAGYDISYIDVVLLNSDLRKPTSYMLRTYPTGAEDEELPPEECSSFAAWGSTTSDGRFICSKASDWILTNQVAIVAFPEEGNNYLAISYSAGMLVGAMGMNNKGVFVCCNSGGASDYGYGISYRTGFQHLLRFADSAAEAKDMLLSWGTAASYNYQISDVSGDSFVVEASADLKGVRQAGDFGETDFIYTTNNALTDTMQSVMKGEEYIEHAGKGSSVSRNLELWNMLHNYQGKIDLDFVKMMWRFPGNPPPYPPEGGWPTQIARPANRSIFIGLPDDGDKGVAHICTGPAGRILRPFKSFRLSNLTGGTHTFYELALASSPAAVVAAAKIAARREIYEAYEQLMTLDYSAPGYMALNDLYSKATSEYFEGFNANNRALILVASGDEDEALFDFAQAATAFTRAQAHALQAYNALVLPPTSPEELGLQPWGY